MRKKKRKRRIKGRWRRIEDEMKNKEGDVEGEKRKNKEGDTGEEKSKRKTKREMREERIEKTNKEKRKRKKIKGKWGRVEELSASSRPYYRL